MKQGIALILMSASPSTSDIRLTVRHVSFGPLADSCTAAKKLDHPIISVGRGLGSEGHTVRLSTLTVRVLFLAWEEDGMLTTEAETLGVEERHDACRRRSVDLNTRSLVSSHSNMRSATGPRDHVAK